MHLPGTTVFMQQVPQKSDSFLCHSLKLDLINHDKAISQAMHLFQWMAEYKCNNSFRLWCLITEC